MTCSECGWHHPVGWSPRLNRKEKRESHLSVRISLYLLPDLHRGEQAVSRSCHHSWKMLLPLRPSPWQWTEPLNCDTISTDDFLVVWIINIPHRFVYLNTWSPAGGTTIWGDYETFRRWSLAGGSVTLQADVPDLYSLDLLPVHFLCFLCMGGNMISQLPVPIAFSSIIDSPSGPRSQNKLLFKLLLAMAFYRSNRKRSFLPYVAFFSKATEKNNNTVKGEYCS